MKKRKTAMESALALYKREMNNCCGQGQYDGRPSGQKLSGEIFPCTGCGRLRSSMALCSWLSGVLSSRGVTLADFREAIKPIDMFYLN